MKMMTSKVTQVTWLINQLINPNNLHVSRNLSIFIVVLAELGEKTKLTNYWPVYELVDDVTSNTTSYHSHIIFLNYHKVSLCLYYQDIPQKYLFCFDFIGKSLELLKILQKIKCGDVIMTSQALITN